MRRPRLRTVLAIAASIALALATGRAIAAISASGDTIAPTAGHEFSGEVATFSDSSPHQYTATIDWGDGSAPTQGTVNCSGCPNSPQFSVQGTHTYAAAGTYPTVIHVVDTVDQDVANGNGSAQVAPP